mmetsp:Transcript_48987/g.78934  ORF Transcript_48987/g.78934 Transcript_48987/m.78934 type:complete len:404 (+) Transcript_48987:409-1620(+)
MGFCHVLLAIFVAVMPISIYTVPLEPSNGSSSNRLGAPAGEPNPALSSTAAWTHKTLPNAHDHHAKSRWELGSARSRSTARKHSIDESGRRHANGGREEGSDSASERVWDLRTGELMTNFSRIAYCPEPEILQWSCATCNESLKGFELFYKEHENSRHVGVYVGYYPRENKAVVVFRGTDYLINWIQDLMVYKVDSDYDCGYYPPPPLAPPPPKDDEQREVPPKPRKRKCKVHSGFKSDWLSVRDNVMNATHAVLDMYPSAELWVTGHSLGGALASLCGLDLQMQYNKTSPNPKTVNLFTLGQPRVGNKDFADFLWEKIPAATRVVHQNDVVPHLPPHGHDLIIMTDFHHHAREVWQTGTEDDTFIQCDDSGEDPRCSNSLTSWDRSVEAHLWYLGFDMTNAC